MHHYRVERVIGDGSFGSVVSARHIPTNSLVAIKHIKRTFASFDDAMREREVQALLSMSPHPAVVPLREVIYERQQLSLVFEHVQGNLLQWLRALSRPLPQYSIQHIMHQLLSAIAHVHQCGVFHRDIKPENLLLQLDNFVPPTPAAASSSSSRPSSRPNTSSASYLTPSVKLADFGQAREIRSRPPYSEYVSTRWYRAPEQLLHSTAYNSPIDVWAAGCIMAELHTLTPLFAGNNETDTLQRIIHTIPPPALWPEGQQAMQRLLGVAGSRGVAAGSAGSTGKDGLRRCVVGASESALDLMAAMLQWDPKSRLTARDALQHPFFDGSLQKLNGGGEQERKEETKEGKDWSDSVDGDSEDAVVEASVDGDWLTASNRYGQLRCRYFPPPSSTDAAQVKDKLRQEQIGDDSRGSMTQTEQQTARGGRVTIASTLDWPTFSDDSDDDTLPTSSTRFTQSNSRSASHNTTESTRHSSPSHLTEHTQPTTSIASMVSFSRSSPTGQSVPSLPANSLSRPSSVSSTQRTRRSFAQVGVQMFPGT